ncbi:hypothetical protein FACS189416_6360 [Bacteroidia bacterium]|nr:hypothetical protein FACS189416_6360 [Bacteroidia bacterium]
MNRKEPNACKSAHLARRQFFNQAASLAALMFSGRLWASTTVGKAQKARRIFDGKTLKGWKAIPRMYIPRDPKFNTMPSSEIKEALTNWYLENDDIAHVKHTGDWQVIDGAIVGKHDPADSLYGAYLISEEKFGDFELELDANPDWPIDTGIMIRAHEVGVIGFQVLVDYRPFGTVGGIYGNSIGSFRTAGFAFNGDKLPDYHVTNLQPSKPDGNFSAVTPTYTASFEDFTKAWKLNDWNHFKIRCIGRIPVITIWVNDVKMCELDSSKIDAPGYDAEAVATLLGPKGHIAFEVHDVDTRGQLGRDRWAIGAACRWKNITVTEL